jgi:para-nitrobenzyl esterase
MFNDDAAPPRYGALPLATHTSELPYLVDLPNAPIQVPLNAAQQGLAADMRAAWANFTATGDPSTSTVPWPSFNVRGKGCRW